MSPVLVLKPAKRATVPALRRFSGRSTLGAFTSQDFHPLEEVQNSALDELPAVCSNCKQALCLRKQVMNLTLGNTDEMFCLQCLGQENDKEALEVLLNLKEYALKRDCFLKEWRRYSTVADCPDRDGCFPSQCFSES